MVFKKYYVIAFLIGLYFDKFQELIGMSSGWDGVEYYSEVHNSFWNSMIHTFFMPSTMFGIFLWIPAILVGDNNSIDEKWDDYTREYNYIEYDHDIILRNSLILFHLGVYTNFSAKLTLMVMLWYFPVYFGSIYFYRNNTRFYNFLIGFTIMSVALCIQEYFGHYLCGDGASRIEGIPNAILYAPFYSVSHIF